MTRKTVKDLDGELNVIKEELGDTKVKLDEFILLCKSLVKNFSSDKPEIKCDQCDEGFQSYKDLNKHTKSHGDQPLKFECEVCACEFVEKWKFNAHHKRHVEEKKHSCDVCSKTFKTEDIKKKHVQVTHNNVQLYCHFFNNRIACPYDDECVFMHEDAPLCKYGGKCERINCMFKHVIIVIDDDEENDEDDDDDDIDGDEDEDDNDESCEEEIDELETDDTTNENAVNKNDSEVDVIVDVTNEDHRVKDSECVMEAGNIETVELKVFVPCRDHWLSKDQVYYTDELRKISEIERIENLWIHSKNNYEIGTYLETDLKFQTKFASKFKQDSKFRQSIWDKIGIKDTYPDSNQGE